MKKNFLITIVSFGVVICISTTAVFLYAHTHNQTLPNTFSIKFTQDNTSSAAERNYRATLVFRNGFLIDGQEAYDADSQNFKTHNTCTLINSLWIDIINKSACGIHAEYFRYIKDLNGREEGYVVEGSAPPLTIADIQTRIKTMDILPVNTTLCQRFMLCYEIENVK